MPSYLRKSFPATLSLININILTQLFAFSSFQVPDGNCVYVLGQGRIQDRRSGGGAHCRGGAIFGPGGRQILSRGADFRIFGEISPLPAPWIRL